MPPDAFAQVLDGVFEHAPWVAAAAAGPYATVAQLHEALIQAVRDAPAPRRTAFLNNHPELQAGALPATLTPESQAEQASLGLHDGSLADLNRLYCDRFGIPFIVCVRRHTAANIMRELHRRLSNTRDAELAAPEALPPLERLAESGWAETDPRPHWLPKALLASDRGARG